MLNIIYFIEIIPTADEKTAFTDIDAAFLVGAMPRREGMERKDLLAANVKIFKSQGRALDQFAKKDVKVNLFCWQKKKLKFNFNLFINVMLNSIRF